ncbi:MAG: transporter associated domain-containing protein [Comamonas sp.]
MDVIHIWRTGPSSFDGLRTNGTDELVGVARAKDMLRDLMQFGAIQPGTLKRPHFVQESTGVIALLGDLRSSKGRMVVVKNEFNVMCGVVTPIDVLEAIAGEFPDEVETFTIRKSPERANLWIARGAADVHLVQLLLGTQQLISANDFYATLGGLLTDRQGAVPAKGTQIDIGDWRFTVLENDDDVLRKPSIESIATGHH